MTSLCRLRPQVAVTSACAMPNSGLRAKKSTTAAASAILPWTVFGTSVRRYVNPVSSQPSDHCAPRASITASRAFANQALSASSSAIIRKPASVFAARALSNVACVFRNSASSVRKSAAGVMPSHGPCISRPRATLSANRISSLTRDGRVFWAI